MIEGRETKLIAGVPEQEDFVSWMWYELAYLINFPLYRALWSLKVRGTNLVPPSGPLLVIANHQSSLDPVGVGVATRRHLCFMAKKSLFSSKFSAWLIRSLGAVPIDKDGIGIAGMKAVMGLLKAGRAVLVFPEGTRSEDGRMKRFEPGVTTLISKVKPTVLPLGIAGATEALNRESGLQLSLPLFPPTRAAMAMCIGKPLRGEDLARMDRESMLRFLFDQVAMQHYRAECLRRKGRYLSGPLLQPPVLQSWPTD